MARRIPDIAPHEPWDSPNVDTWRRELVGQVEENADQSKTVGLFIGGYDQVADSTTTPGGALQTADNFNAGDYYRLTVTGTFSTAIPELNGLTGGKGDQLFSNGTIWVLFDVSTDFLSSQVDDTAAGVITFAQPAVGSNPAVTNEQYIRKGESDASDLQTETNAKVYADTQDSAHVGATDPHADRAYADSQDAAHVAAVDPHGDRAYSDSQLDGRVSSWSSKLPEEDWVPATNDQWIGDAESTPLGIALGTPTGDPDDPGIEGVVAAQQGAGQGIAVIGYGDGDTRASDLGTQANRPVEISGQPVLLMGPTFVEVQNPLGEDHYVMIGQSTQLPDGRHVAPLFIGPEYVPALSESAQDTRDIPLDGSGTLVDVVTLNLTTGPYNPVQSSFSYEVRLAEESSQARGAAFDVEIWANIGGSGLSFVFRDEYFLAGSAQNFSYSTPIATATLNSGDQIVMRVSSDDSHQQSSSWVRGAVRASTLAIRQGTLANANEARLDALKSRVDRAEPIITIVGVWTFAGAGTGFATAPSTFRATSATHSAITEIRFNRFNSDVVDMTGLLGALRAGDQISINQQNDGSQRGVYQLGSDATVDPGGDIFLSNLSVVESNGSAAGPMGVVASWASVPAT